MQVGTYADGRPLNYSEAGNQFDVGGSPVTPENVSSYDQAGHVSWASEELRVWAHQVAEHAVAHAAVTVPTRHDVPHCLNCGYVGPWRVEGILRPMDWVIGLIFMLAAGTGLIYLGVVALIRMNSNNRAKICASCKSRNMFSFQY